MIEVHVRDNGSVVLRNMGDRSLKVWKVVVEYTTSLPGTLYTGEKTRRLRVRESFSIERDLNPGEEARVDTGLDPASINSVTVYFQEQGGSMGKKTLNLNP